MKTIREFKEHNKKLAALAKEHNRRYKEAQKPEGKWSVYRKWCEENDAMTDTSYRFRHYHIAYCLLRGRAYEEIENYVRPGNEPNWRLINGIIERFNNGEQENVRDSEKEPDETPADGASSPRRGFISAAISRVASKIVLGQRDDGDTHDER